MNPVRVLLIGAGHWGSTWVPALVDDGLTELVGVVDRNPAAAAALAATAGVPAFTSIAAALDSSHVDAAFVVTPPETHEAPAVEALSAGLHCLVEKPLAHNMAAARAIVAAAGSCGRTVMISQNYRFHAAPRTVGRLVRDGAIGRPELVRVDFGVPSEPVWGGFLLSIPEPIIARWMIHQFDLIRSVFPGAEFDRLRARSWNPSWSPYAGNASCVIEARSPDGLQLIYTGTWASKKPATASDGEWCIEGTEGAIVWSGTRIDLHRREGSQTVPVDVHERVDKAAVLAEFCSAIATGRTPETAPAANLATLQLLLASLHATDVDGWVDVASAAEESELIAASPSNPDGWKR